MSDAATLSPLSTILVVDDAPQNLSLMSDLLDGLYTVKLATSGARALKIVANSPVDLILLDVMMPEMDGYQVCQALKSNPDTSGIPIIFLTAMDAMEDEEQGLRAGAVDYLAKPISPPILLARVRNQLALKQGADLLREQVRLVEQEKQRAQELMNRVKQAADKILDQNRLLKHEQARAQALQQELGAAMTALGQLDRAWELLAAAPPSTTLADALYDLALAFEAARRFEPAKAAWRAIAQIDPAHRDVMARLSASEVQAGQTIVLGRPANGLAPPPRPATTPAPRTLGRYEISREIGQGAMGKVYVGTDPAIGRIVAIKTLSLDQETKLASRAERRDRFLREAESAGRLNHPGIVAIYDVGEAGDLAYIAMEYLKGQDLSTFTRPGQLLPLDTALTIAERVADALHYAHANGVIHRDIKPANVVYERDSDQVKVTDFGIACLHDDAAAAADGILGTPSYMAPEQVLGQSVDGRSDLYSLGTMLYQLLTGHLPFAAPSLTELLRCIVQESYVDPRTYAPDLPDCVTNALARMLARDPQERYATGEQAARALSICRRSGNVFAR